jgi:hypothetical protein
MVHLTTSECDIAPNTTSSTLFFALSRRWERLRPSSPCSSPMSTRRIAESACLRSGEHSRPSSKQLLLMITSSSLLLLLLDLQRLVVLVPLSFAAVPYLMYKFACHLNCSWLLAAFESDQVSLSWYNLHRLISFFFFPFGVADGSLWPTQLCSCTPFWELWFHCFRFVHDEVLSVILRRLGSLSFSTS